MAQTTRTRARVCLLGVSLILLPILGVKSPPLKTIFVAWIGVFKPNWLYWKSHIIETTVSISSFNKILHNDRDHQVVIVGGPSTCPTNPRWRTAAILQNPLNRHINFWKSKMAAAAILKIIKITISPRRFDRSLGNLVGDAKWCSWPPRPLKNWISKIQDGERPPF